MSMYSKDKCTIEQIQLFKKEVLNWLNKNGINVSKLKIRCQRNYDGNIKIETCTLVTTNKKISIRKIDGSYYRGRFNTEIKLGVYFYRAEWNDFLNDKITQESSLYEIKLYLKK